MEVTGVHEVGEDVEAMDSGAEDSLEVDTMRSQATTNTCLATDTTLATSMPLTTNTTLAVDMPKTMNMPMSMDMDIPMNTITTATATMSIDTVAPKQAAEGSADADGVAGVTLADIVADSSRVVCPQRCRRTTTTRPRSFTTTPGPRATPLATTIGRRTSSSLTPTVLLAGL